MFDGNDFRNRRGERFDTAFHAGTRADVLVLLGHGLTGDKDRPLLVAVAEGLSKQGWPCLRFSFPGNGESDGNFCDATITRESEDLMDLLDQLPPKLRVVYIGHSMGAAVGVKTIGQHARIEVLVSLAGMVRSREFVEREFADVAPDHGLMWDEPGCLLSQRFVDDLTSIGDLLGVIAEITKPILWIHGMADDVVLPKDSVDAYQVAHEPKRLVLLDGQEHSFGEHSYGRVVNEIKSWLEAHLGE